MMFGLLGATLFSIVMVVILFFFGMYEGILYYGILGVVAFIGFIVFEKIHEKRNKNF